MGFSELRYKVISSYPRSLVSIGDTIELPSENWKYANAQYCDEKYFEAWPHIFKKLKWFEERTIDEVLKIEFIKVIKYQGYWRIGDIVPVTKHHISVDNPKLGVLGFWLRYNYLILIENTEPSTKEEYEMWKLKNKIS